jgi:class 3 adenylate cyclase
MPYLNRVAITASEERLEQLIEARLVPGADQRAIDARIWDLFGEQWAVMFTDLSGFSRGVAEFGIIHFLQVIHESQRILVPCIDRHDGILLKSDGDSLLVIFRTARGALECSLAMQQAAQDYGRDRTPAEQVLLCIGLGFGPVLRIGDRDVFGAEVNAAAKLGEDTAKAHEILVTGAVRDAVAGSEPLGVAFEPIDGAPPGAREAFRVNHRR